MANKIIFYYDENGNQTGEGESFTVVDGSTELKPATDKDIFNGVEWVTPVEPEPETVDETQP
ncbi:MAG: hypothetical protein IBX55_15910 [Methyloprofundus sp.]|nr:hypothetical protein [Methyloprofundus sp.]